MACLLRRLRVGVRPGDIAFVRPDESPAAPTLWSEVLVVEPAERTLIVTLRAAGIDFKLKTPAGGRVHPGDRMQVRFDLAALYFFDPATGLTLSRSGVGERNGGS